uniref:Uncharacterized protein n=1 Tax=Mycena chlorophos TaxID=658473 RepID=A0ABQ0KUX6_MYCCL|nr:predicted protein [Mycena chlorophos]
MERMYEMNVAERKEGSARGRVSACSQLPLRSATPPSFSSSVGQAPSPLELYPPIPPSSSAVAFTIDAIQLSAEYAADTRPSGADFTTKDLLYQDGDGADEIQEELRHPHAPSRMSKATRFLGNDHRTRDASYYTSDSPSSSVSSVVFRRLRGNGACKHLRTDIRDVGTWLKRLHLCVNQRASPPTLACCPSASQLQTRSNPNAAHPRLPSSDPDAGALISTPTMSSLVTFATTSRRRDTISSRGVSAREETPIGGWEVSVSFSGGSGRRLDPPVAAVLATCPLCGCFRRWACRDLKRPAYLPSTTPTRPCHMHSLLGDRDVAPQNRIRRRDACITRTYLPLRQNSIFFGRVALKLQPLREDNRPYHFVMRRPLYPLRRCWTTPSPLGCLSGMQQDATLRSSMSPSFSGCSGPRLDSLADPDLAVKPSAVFFCRQGLSGPPVRDISAFSHPQSTSAHVFRPLKARCRPANRVGRVTHRHTDPLPPSTQLHHPGLPSSVTPAPSAPPSAPPFRRVPSDTSSSRSLETAFVVRVPFRHAAVAMGVSYPHGRYGVHRWCIRIIHGSVALANKCEHHRPARKLLLALIRCADPPRFLQRHYCARAMDIARRRVLLLPASLFANANRGRPSEAFPLEPMKRRPAATDMVVCWGTSAGGRAFV